MQSEATQSESREPESLLQGINRSIFTKALLVSTVVHFAFLGVTSFGLYREWGEFGMFSEAYGFHTPSDLKQLRRDRAEEAEDTARQEAEEARRDARRAEAMAEAEAEEAARDAEPTAPRGSQRGTQPPPTEPEVEPLPPRAFSLDDVLDL